MALALGSLCLGASRLLSPPLPRIVIRGPRLTLCRLGNPFISSIGRLQSRVIGEVVAPVALLSAIALSPENTVWYGRHRQKTVISLRSPSLVLLVIGSTPPSSSYWSHPVTQLQPKALLCGTAPLRPPPGPCSLQIGWSLLLWLRTQ